MGTFTVPLQVGDLLGRRFIDVEALVDTGASDTVLPANTLTGLGIEPVAWRTFRLADERTVDYQVGQARIRLEGEDCIALVVFAPEGTRCPFLVLQRWRRFPSAWTRKANASFRSPVS